MAAWDFISYLMENGALGMYEAGDRIPAKLADQKLDEIQSNAYTQAFVEQINDGEPMPTVSEMGQLWSIHKQYPFDVVWGANTRGSCQKYGYAVERSD